MEEKKLTDGEIVKALEYKLSKVHAQIITDCCGVFICEQDILDLIHRLQYGYSSASKASEEWKSKYEAVLKDYYTESQHCDEQKDIIAKQKAEIERLTKERDMYADDLYWKAEVRKREDFITELTVENAEIQKQVDELTDKLGKVLLGVKADEMLAAKGVEQAVKDRTKEIYHLIDMFPIPTRKGQQRYATGFENGLTAIKLKIAERFGVEVE